MPIKEVAIRTTYIDQNRTSHFEPFLDSVRIYKEMIKFSLSSLFCAAIDIGLFTLILSLLSASAISWSLFGATSIARLVSSVANFTINKKVVFENRDSTFTQATKYFMICAVQMVFSWLILQGLSSLSGEHIVLLKITTDIFLFLTNFLVQRIFIFRRQISYEKTHKFSTKRIRWTAILMVVMILSSAFTLLDAFVIPKSYVVVVQDSLQNSGVDIQEDTRANQINVVEVSASSTQADEEQIEAIITDHSYIDEHIHISIETIDEDGVVFYLADIQLSDVSYLKTAFANDTFGKNITQTTSAMAEATNAIFAINGDYYGFRDTGLVIRNGILYRDVSSNSADDQFLTIDRQGNLEIADNNGSTGTELVDSGILQGFTFGPTLVLDGQVCVTNGTEVETRASSKSNPRTAIGQISPLHYLFIVVDGRTQESKGMTLHQLAQEFVDRGATVAYNLDGGGSAAMWLNGNIINIPTDGHKDGERKISDIIYIGY